MNKNNPNFRDLPIKRPEEKATNPKDLIGAKKPNMALIPWSALVGVARCMENGAKKYGPFNWREAHQKVGTMTYLAANLRHVISYLDGEDLANDSGENHLDHAISTLLVIRDAQLCGNSIDDRPTKGVSAQLIDEYFVRNSDERN